MARQHQSSGRLVGARCVAARSARYPRGILNRLARDKRGAAAVMTVIAATSLLGVAGFAVEVGGWYLLRRNMQAAADSAAMAGAINLDANKDTAAAVEAARGVAGQNGFTDGSNSTKVTRLADLGTGSVTVAVERPSTSYLLRVGLGDGATRTISARAVARIVEAGAPPCVHALVASVSVGNNTDITASDCALASDSAASDAFKVGSGGSVANGSGKITAANIITHGGCEGCMAAVDVGKLTLTRSPVPSTYASLTKNSYAGLNTWTPPVQNNCQDMPSANGNTAVTLQPNRCYNSLDVGSNKTVNLPAGVYYIKGGGLNVQGTLTGRSVSIVLLPGNAGTTGNVNINARATIDLSAGDQSVDVLDGVLIYRHAPNAQPSQTGHGEIDINGGASMKLNGAIVAPTSWVTMGGNGATDPTACNIFVVHSMEFRGTSNLSAQGCNLYGTKTDVPRIVRLTQ